MESDEDDEDDGIGFDEDELVEDDLSVFLGGGGVLLPSQCSCMNTELGFLRRRNQLFDGRFESVVSLKSNME